MLYGRNLAKERYFGKLKDQSELYNFFEQAIFDGAYRDDSASFCLGRITDYMNFLEGRLRSVTGFEKCEATKTAADVTFGALNRYLETIQTPWIESAQSCLNDVDHLIRQNYEIEPGSLPLEHPEPVVQSFYCSLGYRLMSWGGN